jgi:GT2 family glycosyltransferase
MMDLSIIIVNYKSSHHVMNCLHSIYESRMNIDYEIIIVDNASKDNSQQEICSLYKEITWIQSDYNAGFARANNMGIKASQGRNILLLNADTIITKNAIEQTIIKFEDDKQYAACGVQLLNTDHSKQQSGAKFIVGGINNFLALPYLGSLIKRIGYTLGMKQHNVVDMNQDMQVDWIVGAFIMTRRSIIEKSGLLDEDFFMYAEEIEWCSRIRKYGPMLLYHEPKVIHIGGGTSSKFYKKESNENFSNLFDKKGKQIILSQLLRIRKQYGAAWYLIHLLVYLFEIILFGACIIIEITISVNKRKLGYSEWKGYTKNIFGISHFIPAIAINKHIFYKA